MQLYIALILAWLIGYMAQVTGLCLVRGVSDLMQGQPVRILAIITSGFWLCVYLPLLDNTEILTLLVRHEFHWTYLVGGLIFGLGAAVNGGCTVSTVSRFSSGDLAMMFTMIGWLAGWVLWESTGFDFEPRELGPPHPLLAWLPVVGLLVITIIFYVKSSFRWPLWNGVMLVGVISGALFSLQPEWPPSNFLRDLSLGILHQSTTGLPSIERIWITALMLLGMNIGALYYKKFAWVAVNLHAVAKHLAAGVLMGLGASLSLGGNDIQILLAVPAISPGGFTALTGMVGGVWLGLLLTKYMTSRMVHVDKQGL